VLASRSRTGNPRGVTTIGPIEGRVVFEGVNFSYAPGKSVSRTSPSPREPRTVTALVGPSGRQATTIGLMALYTPTEGTSGSTAWTSRPCASPRTPPRSVVLQEDVPLRGTILENIAFARPGADRAEILAALARRARRFEFAEKSSWATRPWWASGA